jgi:hypothetical protein
VRVKIIFLLLLLLTACSGGQTPAPAVTDTASPTATSVPTAAVPPTLGTPLAILVVPADYNEEISNAYQKTVYDLAQSVGMRFQVWNTLTPAGLDLAARVVVVLHDDPGLSALAAAAPQTQFLAVGVPGIAPGGNVSVLGAENINVEQQAFMAGYIGAMVTEDYRTGVMLRKGSPDAEKIKTAFRVGQEYFCGLCNPFLGPFEDYPVSVEVPEDAKPNEYGAYADALLRGPRAETLFFQPGLGIPELYDYLNTVGVFMIGTESPAKRYPGWVVTLQPNYLEAIKPAFLELVAGQGGKSFPSPMRLTDANEDVFGAGKQRLAQETLQNLLGGFISTSKQP